MPDTSSAAQSPTLSAGSGGVAVAGQDATLDAPSADERRERRLAAQLERLRAIAAEQTARRARRAAIEAELAQLRAEGGAGEFEAAALFQTLAHPSRAGELEVLRHTTAYPL